jgi:hypothetical protein
MKNLLFITLLLICFHNVFAQTTKEQYLKEYKAFINSVSDEYEKYSLDDWDKTDKKYIYYSSKLFDKFEDELAWEEKYLNVYANDLLYIKYRADYDANYLYQVNSGDRSDYKTAIKNRIKFYIDNNLEDHIDILLSAVKFISVKLALTVSDAIDEYKKEKEQRQ